MSSSQGGKSPATATAAVKAVPKPLQKDVELQDGFYTADGHKYQLVEVTSDAKSIQDGKAEVADTKSALQNALMVLPKGLKFGMFGKSKGGFKVGRNQMPIKTRIANSFTTTSSAGGVIATVIGIDPSVNTAEWAAVQVLYDQYRVRNAKIQFYTTAALTTTPGIAGIVVTYDGSDTTALANVREGCEYPSHLLVSPSVVSGTAAAYVNSLGHPFTFSPKLAGGTRVPTASVPTRDEWATTASPVPFGYFKFYTEGFPASQSNLLTGIVTCEVEFRLRT